MKLKTNCADCSKCQPQAGRQQNNTVSFKINLAEGQVKRKTHLGREFAVVPVVMIKSGVVMNDSLIPTEELHPVTWNGVPVTIGHPEKKGTTVSANSPDIAEDWSVGIIYNTRLENGDLKAEAWLDVERVNELRPELIEELEAGTAMDVSTGYFSDDFEESGEINGRGYSILSRNLNPDHLALLPDVSGACSWEDGCGVRANERRSSNMTEPGKKEESISVNAVTKLLSAMGFGNHLPQGEPLKTNIRGAEDDPRQIIADLISSADAPFLPDDDEALRMLSVETLVKLREEFLVAETEEDVEDIDASEEEEDEEEPDNQEEGDPEVVDKTKKEAKANQGLPQTQGELNTLIANAVKAAVPEAVAEAIKTNSGLTAEQQAALDRAMKLNEDHRGELVTKITTNSDLTEEVIKDWPTSQLELIANGLRVTPTNYGGRGAPVINAQEDDVVVNSMIPPSSKRNKDEKVH